MKFCLSNGHLRTNLANVSTRQIFSILASTHIHQKANIYLILRLVQGKFGKYFFLCWSLVLVSWQAFISSLVMKLDFISQPSSNSTLSFEVLQHMEQCQVNVHSIFTSMLWSKWMVHEKWSPQWGFEPATSQSWVFCLNH